MYMFQSQNYTLITCCILFDFLQISSNDKIWKAWFDSEAPEEAVIPNGYMNSLDTFRKLILIRAWCPDRVLSQARKYISESLGREYAEGVILDMEQMWEESTNRIPMICFLSMGSDPSNNIDALARKHKISKLLTLMIIRLCENVFRIWYYLCATVLKNHM